MEIFLGQRLAGTRLDLQGERTPKSVLDEMAQTYRGRRMPLNNQHDFARPSPGYVEKMGVAPDIDNPGEWALIGDVHIDEENLEIALGGFSISFLEVTHRGSAEDFLHVYLPYPHYNNEELIDALFEDGFVSVGRWRKKSVELSPLALIGAVAVFVFKPVWEDLYKTQIAPRIYEFFLRKNNALREKGIDAMLGQNVLYEDQLFEVYLTPPSGRAETCLTPETINEAMKLAHHLILSRGKENGGIHKLFLRFDEGSSAYVVGRIEYRDGTLQART